MFINWKLDVSDVAKCQRWRAAAASVEFYDYRAFALTATASPSPKRANKSRAFTLPPGGGG